MILIMILLAGPLFLVSSSRELGVRMLESRFMKWIGDLSYSIYLVHNLIIYPVLSRLAEFSWYTSLGNLSRFGVSLFLITPIVVGVSYLLFRFVEIPGINLGRKILSKK